MRRRFHEFFFALMLCALLMPTSNAVGFTGAPKSAVSLDVSVADLMQLECVESDDGLEVYWPGPSPFRAPHSIQGIRVGDSFDDLLERFGHYGLGQQLENGAWGWDSSNFSCDPSELESTNYLTDTLFFGDGEVICTQVGPAVAVTFDSQNRANSVSDDKLDLPDDTSFRSIRHLTRQLDMQEPSGGILSGVEKNARPESLKLLDAQTQALARKFNRERPFTIIYSDGLRVEVKEPGGRYRFELQ